MIRNGIAPIVLLIITWCLRKRLKRRLEPAHLPDPTVATEVGYAAVEVKNLEVVYVPKTRPSTFDSPILLTDIRLVSETDIPYERFNLVKIPVSGGAKRLQVTKTTPKTWSVQGEIAITSYDDRPKILFYSRNGRHRGSAYIQIDRDAEDSLKAVIDFYFEFETEQPPNLRIVANLGTSYNSNTDQMDTKDSSLPKSKPVDDDIDEISSQLFEVGTSYLEPFDRTGDLAALNQAIERLQFFVDLTPDGHPRLPLFLCWLGVSYSERFERSDDLNDLNLSLSNNKKAVEITPPGDPDLPDRLNSLGVSYSKLFKRKSDPNDLALAMSNHRNAVDNARVGHPRLPIMMSNLANQYILRFEQTANPEDLQFAIANHQMALAGSPADCLKFPVMLYNLGGAHSCRFGLTGDIKDLDIAISNQTKAVEMTPNDDFYLSGMMYNLGISYSKRFDCTGNIDDLSFAISTCQKSINHTRHGNHGWDLAENFEELGVLYSKRFDLTGNLDDIALVILNLKRAAEFVPAEHPDLPCLLSQLAEAYYRRFFRTRDLGDLELAFSNQKKAVETSPSEHPDLPYKLGKLGLLYSNQYKHTKNLNDLALSIQNTSTAIETARVSDPKFPSILQNAGVCYFTRFERTGNFEDLTIALSYEQKAVEATQPGDPSLSSRLTGLAVSYVQHFTRTGDLNYLDLSISNQQKAIGTARARDPNQPRMLGNLGALYSKRFHLTGDFKDLALAISNNEKAVEAGGIDHPEFSILLGNLANNYAQRFSVTEDFDDLALAISNQRKALEATPFDHEKLEILRNLSSHYVAFCKWMGPGSPDNFDQAISYQQDAVDLTPPEHPLLPETLSKLGRLHMARFLLTREKKDRNTAISLCRQGASKNGAPAKRFESAQVAAELAFEHEPSNCMVDCSIAMDLLSQLVGFDQILLHRHHHLREASTFTSFSVAAALHFKRIDLALKWLEQGRCLVWNQITQLRSSSSSLRNEHRELADELDEVTRALDVASSRPASLLNVSDITIKDEISLQDAATQHSSLAIRYDALLNTIREKNGFADFLLLGNVDNLVPSLPLDGPIVVLNSTSSPYLCRFHALILEKGKDIQVVPLRSITISQVQTMAENLHQRLCDRLRQEKEPEADNERATRPAGLNKRTNILVMLWEEVVEPIFKALGYLDSPVPSLSDRRRLWWCPAGPFMFLPLHAAHAAQTKPSKSVADFVVSSYTPTISTLISKYNAASSMTAECTGVAVISQPYAPGFSAIPATIKEVQTVNRLLDCASIPHDLLEDRDATIGTVTGAMGSRSWLHFACHGVQDEKDPLSSGLALQDGLLKLSDIVRERPPHTDFAFLSACQTGKGVADLSDEAVHIAAGMLAIGFNSVIGTMWSISDDHGPKFAEDVYKYLIRDAEKTGKLDSSKAAHALDYATREFRKRYGYGDVSSAWIPYVHFGY